MNWIHYSVASIAAGIAVSLTDWIFTGVLFHGKYLAYPEIWRKRNSEGPVIACSTVLGFVTSAAFIGACSAATLHGYRSALELAGFCWLAVPMPLLVTNALYIKIHPLVVCSHALGWLVRLVLAAVAAGWLLS
jgi:hypothetical protein